MELDKAAYNDSIERLRDDEYPMLRSSVYLDHAGSTLCAKSLMADFAAEMTSALYGNPHSGSPSSQLSSSRIEDIRLRLLSWFKADPAEYDLVFVSNATAGVKLVVEGMRTLPQGFSFAYHQACHTSLVGVREEAAQSVCLDDNDVSAWLQRNSFLHGSSRQTSAILFAYSAQSHMDGRRYPLSWPRQLGETFLDASPRIFTLLDAASYSATSQLDLSHPDFAADFTVLSLYKIFGFPDLGALIVRHSAESVFDNRKFFGGGTVDMVTCGTEQWHVPKSRFLHERLEDGTLPFHSIMAIDIALSTHQRLFGSMDRVNSHTSYLTYHLVNDLNKLRHANGRPVCVVYTTLEHRGCALEPGPVVSFNITNRHGAWVSLAEFEKLATLKHIHVRTGGLCSPGSVSAALALEPWEIRRNFSAGVRCGTGDDVVSGKPTGVIRASLGAMSTMSDVSRFVCFLEEFFVERDPTLPNAVSVNLGDNFRNDVIRVKTITVYPIKSCGGYQVPNGSSWKIRPEGLAWDREWCLLHRGSRQALSQKRCPKMALLQPTLDFERGILKVKYLEENLEGDASTEVSVALSADPSFYNDTSSGLTSWVCGDKIIPQTYVSQEVNDFFTQALGIPCVLARFPPGGRGLGSRAFKAELQSDQKSTNLQILPGSFPEPPTPPDSDSERSREGSMLLSNESPILMIHRASVDALNEEIGKAGGDEVEEMNFRANIVVEGTNQPAYAEDSWSSVRIGQQSFKVLGGCRRCQMVCVNQKTGEKSSAPFVALAKTRRFDGKVYFGMHMRHEPAGMLHSKESQNPTIQVGDSVMVDAKD